MVNLWHSRRCSTSCNHSPLPVEAVGGGIEPAWAIGRPPRRRSAFIVAAECRRWAIPVREGREGAVSWQGAHGCSRPSLCSPVGRWRATVVVGGWRPTLVSAIEMARRRAMAAAIRRHAAASGQASRPRHQVHIHPRPQASHMCAATAAAICLGMGLGVLAPRSAGVRPSACGTTKTSARVTLVVAARTERAAGRNSPGRNGGGMSAAMASMPTPKGGGKGMPGMGGNAAAPPPAAQRTASAVLCARCAPPGAASCFTAGCCACTCRCCCCCCGCGGGGGRAHGTLHRLNGCRGDILLFEHHVMIGEDDDVVPRAPMPCPLRPLQPEQKQRAAAPCGCGGMQHGPHAVHAPPAPPPPSPGSWAPTTHRRAFACDKGLIMRVLLLIHGAQRLGAIAARVVASDARAATLLPRRRACMVHGLHGRGSRSIGGPCVSQAYNAQGRPAGWEARARASEHAPEFAASSCTPDGTAARVCSTRARCARSAQS